MAKNKTAFTFKSSCRISVPGGRRASLTACKKRKNNAVRMDTNSGQTRVEGKLKERLVVVQLSVTDWKSQSSLRMSACSSSADTKCFKSAVFLFKLTAPASD
ncbi:uncharacterized [Lates japonicus]